MGPTLDVAIPLPTPDSEDREPPRRPEVEAVVRGIATAASPTGRPEGLTPVQRAVQNALAESMTGVVVDAAAGDPLGPEEFAEVLRFRSRNVAFAFVASLKDAPSPSRLGGFSFTRRISRTPSSRPSDPVFTTRSK